MRLGVAAEEHGGAKHEFPADRRALIFLGVTGSYQLAQPGGNLFRAPVSFAVSRISQMRPGNFVETCSEKLPRPGFAP